MTDSDTTPQRPSLFLAEPSLPLPENPQTVMDVAEPPPGQTNREPQPTTHESQPEPDPPRNRRNPWLVLLWVLAVILTCAGFWAQLYGIELTRGKHLGYVIGTGEGTTFSAPSVIDFYVLPVVLASFAPWLVAMGLAAAVGATLVHALAWTRRES